MDCDAELARLQPQQFQHGFVVAIGSEHRLPVVAPLDDVVRMVRKRNSREARHRSQADEG
jgi:hypothetical protein